jgi:hypothetical protein
MRFMQRAAGVAAETYLFFYNFLRMTTGWFLTELIFRVHDENTPSLNKFDKQMRLLQASSKREAYQNALVMASHELDIRNTPAQGLQWEFAGIGMLHTIESPAEDIELQSTVEVQDNAKEYMLFLRAKNESLQMQIALSA